MIHSNGCLIKADVKSTQVFHSKFSIGSPSVEFTLNQTHSFSLWLNFSGIWACCGRRPPSHMRVHAARRGQAHTGSQMTPGSAPPTRHHHHHHHHLPLQLMLSTPAASPWQLSQLRRAPLGCTGFTRG